MKMTKLKQLNLDEDNWAMYIRIIIIRLCVDCWQNETVLIFKKMNYIDNFLKEFFGKT